MASATSPARPDDSDLIDDGQPAGGADWSFARRPFWLFSHLFALSVIVLFAGLGLWQLSRHDARQETNTAVADRLDAEPRQVTEAGDLAGDPAELDYRPVLASGTFIDEDFVRVVNRSQGGVAGEHVVGIVELEDGTTVAVNRGFVPVNADPVLRPAPVGPTTVTGWLRESVSQGRFGVDDSGRGDLVPRLNTADLAARLGRELPAVWIQASEEGPVGGGARGDGFPDPVPLPELDSGPHLGYAVQWFIFAVLGTLFYGALLRRQSRPR